MLIYGMILRCAGAHINPRLILTPVVQKYKSFINDVDSFFIVLENHI